jgi:gas vesicle protein
MRGKSALLVGIIIGVVVGNTRQGRAAFRSVGERVSGIWQDRRVQERVDDIQAQLKERVPVVGDDIAEAIDRVKPAKTAKPPAASGTDPLGGVGAANLG